MIQLQITGLFIHNVSDPLIDTETKYHNDVT